MVFDKVIENLNQVLKEKQPSKFSPTWISENNPQAYRYIWKNIRSARGKPPQCSINDKLFDGECERIDFVVQETERYKYSSY